MLADEERSGQDDGLFGGGDLGAQAASGQLGGDLGLGRGVGGAAEEGAVGAVDECVAAFEDAERAEGLKLGGGAVEASVSSLNDLGAGGLQALVQGFAGVAVVGQAEGGVPAAKAAVELGEARGAPAELGVDRGLGAEA